MFFPKTEFCPFNVDEQSEVYCDNSMKRPVSDNERSDDNMEVSPEYDNKCELMKKIQETSFAVVDLNLYLDTHPDCQQAMELFQKLTATLKSLKADYQRKYGPLYATQCHDRTPFTWVSDDNKWPWEI